MLRSRRQSSTGNTNGRLRARLQAWVCRPRATIGIACAAGEPGSAGGAGSWRWVSAGRHTVSGVDGDLEGNARAALRRLVGRADVDFHDGQLESVLALVRDRERVLVVQRTGWGKSAVYFVATALLRAGGAGPTIIVSPLLSLMRDQIAAATRAGIRAVTMNSANTLDWAQVRQALADDAVDVILVLSLIHI